MAVSPPQTLWDVREAPPHAFRPLLRQVTQAGADLVFRRVPVEIDATTPPEFAIAMRQLFLVHGVGPLLGLRVETGEQIGDAACSGWLRDELNFNRLRLGRVRQRLDTLLACCARAGIEAIPLKGGALLLEGVEALAWRTIGDIDLLVKGGSTRDWDLAVAHAGYCFMRTCWKHREYSYCEEQPWSPDVLDGSRDYPISLELHPAVAEFFRGARWDITQIVRSGLVNRGGVCVPGDLAMALHLAVHASVSMLEGHGRMIHIVDLDRALQRVSADAFLRAMQPGPLRHTARFVYPAVTLVARETGNGVAAEISTALRGDVAPGMATWADSVALYDVSYLGRFDRRPLDRAALWAVAPGDRARMLAATAAPSPAVLASQHFEGEGLAALARWYPRYYGGLLRRVWEHVRGTTSD